MSEGILRDLKFLRERREQRALVELQSRNRFRDSVSDALTKLRGHIDQEQTSMRRNEVTRYGNLVGQALSVEEAATMAFTIDQARSRVALLQNRGGQLQAIVEKATTDAIASKAMHASYYKAERKWAKIVDDAIVEREAEEDRSQELVNEDLSLVIKPGI